jgi:predicted dehydrogenase
MLKLAVVGCGGIGLNHIRAVNELPQAELTFCVDFDHEKAERGAELSTAEAGFSTSLKDIPPDIDGVIVATPPHAHYKPAYELLERGYNVFSEKPLSLMSSHCRKLITLAEKHSKCLMVGFKMRFEPVFVKAAELVPELGRIYSIASTKQQPFHVRPAGNWVPDTGAMFELSVHDFDLINFITGLTPRKISAADFHQRRNWKAEDRFALTVQYNDGVIGQLQGMYTDSCTFNYHDLMIQITGENGYLRIERPEKISINTDEYREIKIENARINTFKSELSHFCDVLNGHAQNMLPGKLGLITTWMVEEARKTAKRQTAEKELV